MLHSAASLAFTHPAWTESEAAQLRFRKMHMPNGPLVVRRGLSIWARLANGQCVFKKKEVARKRTIL